MKVISVQKCALFLCLFSSSGLIGQIENAGVQLKYNFANHLIVQQETPLKFARSLQSMLSSPGADIYADYSMNDKWALRTKFGFETKGFVGNRFPEIMNEGAFKFRHLTLDISMIRYYGKGGIKPYNYIGLSTGYLLKKELPDLRVTEPDEADVLPYEGYKKSSIGYLLGAGVDFHNVLWLELEVNRDFLKIYDSGFAYEYNYIFAIQAGVNILNLFD